MKRRTKPPAWTPFVRATHVTGPGTRVSPVPAGFMLLRNSRYQVLIRRLEPVAPFGEGYHLSIKRNDRAVVHDWRDLQRIKNEVVGPEAEAIELYPAESRKLDTANQYHLWVFPAYRFQFGQEHREISSPEDNARDPDPVNRAARQRPFEEGDPWYPIAPAAVTP